MADKWLEVPLGQLVEVFDGPHATPAKTAEGPIFLGISNLVNGRIDLSGVEHLSETDFPRWTRRVEPRPGDIVFSYETRLGEAAQIPSGLRCCLGRRMGLLRVVSNRIHPRFLLYAFLGPEFQETIRQRTIHGSTVDRIPLTELPDFPIRIPKSIEEQTFIASILGALDDKIALNGHMNHTLEQIAQTLFRSWFVDFDPVWAKKEGRQPVGMDAVTAALFPDEFEDSELGPIPEGWKVEPLSNIVEILSGGTPKTAVAEYWNGVVPWVSVKDLEPGPFVVHTEKTITEAGLRHSAANLLPPRTVVISARGTVGRLAILGTPMAINQSCYGLHAIGGVGQIYLLQLVRHRIADMQSMTHGTVFDTITRETFDHLSVLVPPPTFVARYEEVVAPLYNLVLLHQKECDSLGALRDLLLPRLLSGEVSVGPPEERIADASF